MEPVVIGGDVTTIGGDVTTIGGDGHFVLPQISLPSGDVH